MTELIIIGNGFDLAHGMKTAYSDYIRAMLLDALKNRPQYGKDSPFYLGKDIESFLRESEHTILYDIRRSNSLKSVLSKLYRNVVKRKRHTLSPLVSLLIEDFVNKGWVDLEQSYFDVLCQYYKDKDEIKQLNEDMRLLEKSLHTYLKEIKPTHRSLSISEHITNIRDTEKRRLISLLESETKIFDSLHNKGYHPFDFSNLNDKISHNEKVIDGIKRELQELLNKKFVVLNFNYTNTIGLYFEEDEYTHVPIHNTLADEEIILGYGDETCEMYKTLENANNNELLKYFKSFYYMKTSHYRDLERIVSSDKFRIHIMGHSCGLSDRVLLSSLFNHENLEYIRVYYYEPREDKNDHFDKCLNISRHSHNKHQMRCNILPLKGPEDTLEYKRLSYEEKDLLGLTKSVPLVPFYEQNIENSDRWEALPKTLKKINTPKTTKRGTKL